MPSPSHAALVPLWDEVSRLHSALLGRRDTLAGTAESAREAEAEALSYAQASDEAAALLRSLSDTRTRALTEFLGGLVTEGLRAVFEDQDLEFVVSTRTLRGNLAVEFSLVSAGVLRPVLGSHGGGVAEVVSFVLRLSVAYLSGLRVLALDEPFARVSADYRPRLAEFVRVIVDRLGMTLLVVTHDPDLPLVADHHLTLRLRDGLTEVGVVDA